MKSVNFEVHEKMKRILSKSLSESVSHVITQRIWWNIQPFGITYNVPVAVKIELREQNS